MSSPKSLDGNPLSGRPGRVVMSLVAVFGLV